MIEKNIFQTWYTRKVHRHIRNEITKIRMMNPDYSYKFFIDDEMDAFVNEHYKGEIADCYNRLNIIVAKADFWRYLILYKYGGVYLDIDSTIKKPLSQLIREDDTAIITAEGNPDIFVQWGLIFKKEHPILKHVIELVVRNIKENRYPESVLNTTGPCAFTEAIQNIHKQYFNTEINQKEITRHTDILYTTDSFNYRIYSIDYNRFLQFKHPHSSYLYSKKKEYWKDEKKKKSLLKDA